MFFKMQKKIDYLDVYNKCKLWIDNNSSNEGIFVSSKNRMPYPEVTGYFIPSLLNWGDRERAIKFAHWLISIQNQDGSWMDPSGKTPYTFDTGQILKGLIALVDLFPEFEKPIKKGCDWILNQVKESGEITTPDKSQWQLPNGKFVPEAIHLYVLEPIKIAGEKWNVERYKKVVDKALQYYVANPDIAEFNTLSHFHAYIVEALVDLGVEDKARQVMDKIAKLQGKKGAVPAYVDVGWVCSTGLFQYAVIWYKLGDYDRADKAFEYACRLQNDSGGFWGGYGDILNRIRKDISYFPQAEISWAVKYFLDAFWWKIVTGFNKDNSIFPDVIDEKDGRYQLIAQNMSLTAKKIKVQTVIDMGCGKGRFLKLLKTLNNDMQFFGMDISEKMLDCLPDYVEPIRGNLLNIPYPNESFDFAFCVEALEHAVDIPRAIHEMGRVIVKNGVLIIIDKDIEKKGQLEIADWEQWFSERELSKLLRQEGFEVSVIKNIPYNGNDGADGLFTGWIAEKI